MVHPSPKHSEGPNKTANGTGTACLGHFPKELGNANTQDPATKDSGFIFQHFAMSGHKLDLKSGKMEQQHRFKKKHSAWIWVTAA